MWLLYNKLDIPADRMTAAFWVLQFSIATCAIGVLCIPYDAFIIANEKMSAFAFLSILDVTMKLLMVLLLMVIPFDKLILYGLFLLLVQLMDRIIYGVYCWKKFPETREAKQKDFALIKEMFGFAGWNLLGNMASIVCAPVINVFLNLFFGPVVNAARGVALQVQGAVKGFITNFQLAVIPQITKSYASGNLNRLHTLIISSSKFSYFLFLLMALPLFIEARPILELWLVEVPEHTVSFMRLVFLIMLVESWEQPLHTANLATGRIKKFQSVKGISLLMTIPISYLALRLGAKSEAVFIIQLLVTFSSLIIQLLIIRPLIELPLRKYFYEVLGRTFGVTAIASIIPLVANQLLGDSFISMLIVIVLCPVSIVAIALIIGLDAHERIFVFNIIKRCINLTIHK